MQLLTTSVKTSYVTLFICQYWSILDQIKYTWSKISKYYGHIHVFERDKFQEWNLYRPCTCSFPCLIGCTLLTPNNFLIVLHCLYLYFLKFQQMIMLRAVCRAVCLAVCQAVWAKTEQLPELLTYRPTDCLTNRSAERPTDRLNVRLTNWLINRLTDGLKYKLKDC